jgi:predicted O-methyltransferase YrrM
MDKKTEARLDLILAELEMLGEDNDARVERKDQKYLNITRDTGELLAVLIKSGAVKQVLEVGTSNGYSTLWIASALPEDGHVTTLEVLPHKIEQANANFKRAELNHKINIIPSSVDSYFQKSDQKFDLVFLDADRTQYIDLAEEILARVRPGGLLVCDNAISHESEMRDFMNFVNETGEFTTALVPVGKGEFVACKETTATVSTNQEGSD